MYAVEKHVHGPARRVSGFQLSRTTSESSPAPSSPTAASPAPVTHTRSRSGTVTNDELIVLRPADGQVWVLSSAMDQAGIARAFASSLFSPIYNICLPPGAGSSEGTPRTSTAASPARLHHAQVRHARSTSASYQAPSSSAPPSREASVSPERSRPLWTHQFNLRAPHVSPSLPAVGNAKVVQDTLLASARTHVEDLRRRLQTQLTTMYKQYEEQLSKASVRAIDEETELTSAVTTDQESLPPDYSSAPYVSPQQHKHGFAFDPPVTPYSREERSATSNDSISTAPVFHMPRFDASEDDLFTRRSLAAPMAIGSLGSSLHRPSMFGQGGPAGAGAGLSASLARTSSVLPPPGTTTLLPARDDELAPHEIVDESRLGASPSSSPPSHLLSRKLDERTEQGAISHFNLAHRKDKFDDPAFGVRSDYDGEALAPPRAAHKSNVPSAIASPTSPAHEEEVDEGAAFEMDEEIDQAEEIEKEKEKEKEKERGLQKGFLDANQAKSKLAPRMSLVSEEKGQPEPLPFSDMVRQAALGEQRNGSEPHRARGALLREADDDEAEDYAPSSLAPSHRPRRASAKPFLAERDSRWVAARNNPRFGGGFSDATSNAGDDSPITVSGSSNALGGGVAGSSSVAIDITNSRIGFRTEAVTSGDKHSGFERQPKTSLPLGEKRLVPPLKVNQSRRPLPTIQDSSPTPGRVPVVAQATHLNHFPVGESPRVEGRRPTMAQSLLAPMVGSLTQRGFDKPFVRAGPPPTASATPSAISTVGGSARPPPLVSGSGTSVGVSGASGPPQEQGKSTYVRPQPPKSLGVRLVPNPKDHPTAIKLFAVPPDSSYHPFEQAEHSTGYKEHTRQTLEFMHTLFQLKVTRRTGWLHHRVPPELVESVSDHMYRMAVLAMLLPGDDVDIGRCVQLALVHDLAEAEVGDVTPLDGIDKKEKERRERSAIEYLVHTLLQGSPAGMRILTLWNEYEDRSTKEARLVKDLDRFELALQAFEYERVHGIEDLQGFFAGSVPYISHPRQRQWASALAQERAEFWATKGQVYLQPSSEVATS